MREFQLLSRIMAANDALRRRFGALVSIPPGDDMAGVRLAAAARARTGELLAAVDQVIVGRHVLPGTPWSLVGRKAVCRNLSDIAAMAGRPLACLAAAALPAALREDDSAALYESIRATAERYDCPLVGGDTGCLPAQGDAAVISLTVLADLPPGVIAPVRRDGARPGDSLYVTGRLGGSFGVDGMGRHLTFEPRINEAVELARTLGARLRAMIDLSDGLAGDAGHLARSSGVGVMIECEALPCAEGCSWVEAISDGEDYELCFAAAGPVPAMVEGVPIARVGAVVAGPPGSVTVLKGGEAIEPPRGAWEHGAGERSAPG
jgi:thiamine-monophosphate kinase